MATITVPDDIDVSLPGPRPEQDASLHMTFARDFVVRVLLADPKWGANMDEIYDAMDIRGAFKDVFPGSAVSISSTQLSKLQDRMRSPSTPYNPVVAVQLRPFFEAIRNPTEP